MVRKTLTQTRFRIAAALAIVSVAIFSATAAAQALQKLTVESFSLSSDTPNPKLEVPFHLIVRVHVRERVSSTAFDNLVLPILAELELRGDERQVRTSPSGTDYTETIAVVAHHTGRIEIAPATLQAIDARDGRAKQYSSNPLAVNVVGGSLDPLAGAGRFGENALRWLLQIALWAGGIICVLALAALVFYHRPAKRLAPPPQAQAPVPVPPPPAPRRSRRDQLSDALTVLRAERNRGAAVAVRAAVWRMIGASDGETLADVLQRPDASDARMRSLLRSLERAAFTYDADLTPAIDDACANLETMLA